MDFMNTLKRYIIAGIVFVSVLGTLAHFFYQWSGENIFVGMFNPVSESTWEHMKLIFFPMALFSIFSYFSLREKYPCILSALTCGILAGTWMIPLLFYTYTGILGFNLAVLDISTFFISVLFAFYTIFRLAESCTASGYTILLTACVFLQYFAFMVFTYMPPSLGLFAPPA